VKELQATRKHLTLKKLASQISIQNTYLSKALNDEKTHLNEDHLYSICQLLELEPEETDFLLLLRSHATAQDPARKSFLYTKLEKKRRKRRLNAEVQDYESSRLTRDMGYLFDPLCAVVYVSLHIPQVQKNTRVLTQNLGITLAKLKEILRTLVSLELVEMSADDPFAFKRFLKSQIHYGRDHPLMRVHQSLLKTMVHSQLLRTAEEDKHSVLVSFTTDEGGFAKIKDEFQAFLKRVEGVVGASKDTHTYQLSFDLFKWF
jgi:DNA-binding Xre family transcriptional regulator